MVIAKMRAAHVPMKILGFHIEREHIGQQRPQGVANFLDAGTLKIGGCIERFDRVTVGTEGTFGHD